VTDLRIRVFRDWPYLYNGTLAYERGYLQPYRTTPGAIVVGAFDGDRLVGAATGTPMEGHADEFATALAGISTPTNHIFYAAESLLLPDYRGKGLGHRFFDLRESHARSLGRSHMAFCSVIRPDTHPLRPQNPRDNGPFWVGRGYAPLLGAIAQFEWRDIGAQTATPKPLQFWIRTL
jgi:GNAT superfamily N-acetyltransferase